MNYGITDFLMLLGSLGLFIYGMLIMSEGIQKLTGSRLRQILSTMTSNRFLAVFTGFLVTSLLQSSSATTVMVVSFVNAGLFSLAQSMGVIMGANIGTTITAWIVSFFGFKMHIMNIAIILIGLAFPLIFLKNSKYYNIGEFIIGFGILFIGLDFLKNSVPDIKANPEILSFLQHYTNLGFLSTLLFIGIGTLLTIIIQSSSATMAITLIMLAEGWINFPIACAMVLGENIGTTITANLAALVGNIHARRAARFHTMFNLIGVAWMLLVFPYFIEWVDKVMEWFSPSHVSILDNTATARANATLGLSLFHTMFNIANMLLLIGFLPQMEQLILKFVKPRKVKNAANEDDEDFSLKHIARGPFATPDISIAEAQKETENFGELIAKMFHNVQTLLFERPQNAKKLINKIAKREGITDDLEVDIADFLAKISEEEISEEGTHKIKSILSMINDMERIGDILFEMTLTNEKIEEQGLRIGESNRNEIKKLFDLVFDQLRLMNINLKSGKSKIDMNKVWEIEKNINETRTNLQELIFKSIEAKTLNARESIFYYNIINSAERIGDHIININEAIVGIK